MSEKIQIIPYSTPDGIISLVPFQNYEQLKRQLDNAINVSRDRLLAAQNAEAESKQLREELERMTLERNHAVNAEKLAHRNAERAGAAIIRMTQKAG